MEYGFHTGFIGYRVKTLYALQNFKNKNRYYEKFYFSGSVPPNPRERLLFESSVDHDDHGIFYGAIHAGRKPAGAKSV
jgi:hypothetical protein